VRRTTRVLCAGEPDGRLRGCNLLENYFGTVYILLTNNMCIYISCSFVYTRSLRAGRGDRRVRCPPVFALRSVPDVLRAFRVMFAPVTFRFSWVQRSSYRTVFDPRPALFKPREPHTGFGIYSNMNRVFFFFSNKFYRRERRFRIVSSYF